MVTMQKRLKKFEIQIIEPYIHLPTIYCVFYSVGRRNSQETLSIEMGSRVCSVLYKVSPLLVLLITALTIRKETWK
ncbi:hypothetical protein ZOSMA_113G00460 [Zostera marina]|uniref:Uncharacterized protein n=1 Tax=Zostera marina TaxID=29655 RepID=A0A0K9Q2Q9_ZOSMR|nr:hypothetical protein ZOSMA_113G00460 [Zostera marina]